MSDRLLTAAEVAELLSVPESWVRRETRAGRIPHVRLGRYRRYEREAVLEWREHLRAGQYAGTHRGPRAREPKTRTLRGKPRGGRVRTLVPVAFSR